MIDVEARFSAFQDTLDKVQATTKRTADSMSRAFSGFNTSLAALGVGLGGAGLVAFAKAGLDSVAALDDLSEKTSLTVETLSKLQEVTRVGGQSLDVVAAGASRFAKSVSAANGGNKEMVQLFQQLGISAADLKNQSFDTIFERFGTTVATASDKTNALAIAQKLAGKSAAELLPFFNDLADRGLGLARVTTEQAAAAEKVQKNFAELSRASAELRDSLVGQLLPALIRVSGAMAEASRNGAGFFGSILAGFGSLGSDLNGINKQIVDETDHLLKLQKTLEQQSGSGSAFFGKSNLEGLKKSIKDSEDKLKSLQKLANMTENGIGLNPPANKVAGRTVGAVGSGDGAQKSGMSFDELLAKASLKRLEMADDAEKKANEREQEIEDLFSKAAMKRIEMEDQRVQAADAEEKRLTDIARGYMDLIDPLAQYVRKLEEIDKLEDLGLLKADAALEARFRVNEQMQKANEEINGVAKAAKESDDMFKDLGLTMASAFEKAVIEGKNLREVLQGLLKDIAQMVLRKGVTKPIADGIGDLFKDGLSSLFGGAKAGGGPVSGGMSYLVGENGPEIFSPGSSGNIIPNGAMGGGDFNINVNFGSGPPTDPQAVMAQLVPVMRGIARGEIGSQLRPGGVFRPA